MKSEKLQDAIGEVRDEYIQDAEFRVAKKQTWFTQTKDAIAGANTLMKGAAAVICLCLIGAGLFALNHKQAGNPEINPELAKITIPQYASQGMGFEGLMYYASEELQNGNPGWVDSNPEGQRSDTLPVYKNGCFDPSGSGAPQGLNEAEMKEKLDEAVQSLGLEITETKRETLAQKTEEGDIISGDTLCALQGMTENGSVTVRADGTVTYMLPPDYTLPPEYHFAYFDVSDEEAQKVMEYLVTVYADFLGFENPKIVLRGDYTFAGEYSRDYCVYDASGDYEERILNYCFRAAEFAPDDEGNLMLIRKNDGLAKAEKIGDYPLISVEEARKKLSNGQYQTSVPVDMPGEKYIAKTELVYRSGVMEETLLPYYRFYVELQDADGWQMTWDNGLKTYGAYYVPAIRDEYIAN